MDPLTIGILALAGLMALLLLSVPIGVAMAMCGLCGTAAIIGTKPAVALFGTTVYSTVVTYDLSIIPLFLLMGAIAARTGLSREFYTAFYTWLGALRGGLGLATICTCGAFSAICGSSVATAATMSRVAIPQMRLYGYSDELATATVAAGGTIGILIPPSVIMVLYGILTESSIGDLFIAGIVPGLLTILGFMAATAIVARIRPEAGPPGESSTASEKLRAITRIWAIALLFGLVMGGIYLGVFTPTEAAGVGAFCACGVALVRRRLTVRTMRAGIVETLRTTAMIFVILIGALTLNNLMIFSGLAGSLSSWVAGLALPPQAVMAIVLLLYLLLGCLVDTLAMVLLTVPIFFPIVTHLGFDPIWFGVIVVMVAELGLITPPVGMNLFVIKGMVPEVRLPAIYRGILPFVVAQILLLLTIFLAPQIALWLPETARALRG